MPLHLDGKQAADDHPTAEGERALEKPEGLACRQHFWRSQTHCYDRDSADKDVSSHVETSIIRRPHARVYKSTLKAMIGPERC